MHISKKKELSIKLLLLKHLNRMALSKDKTVLLLRLLERCFQLLNFLFSPLSFWAEAVATACYTQNRSIIISTHEKTAYHIINDRKPSIKHLHIFGIMPTKIELTLEQSQQGVSNDVLNHMLIADIEDDIMDPVMQCTTLLSHSGFSQQKLVSFVMEIHTLSIDISLQDCLIPSKTQAQGSYSNDEPKSDADDPKQVKDGRSNASNDKDKSEDDSSIKEDNTAEQQVNTASPGQNTSSSELNTIDFLVNTATPKVMLGVSDLLEATNIKFFSDEDELDAELGNIPNSYAVSTTPNIRIYKDHLLEDVIGDMQSSVQTRGMKRSTSE
ncbi:hypothetical protein Tco_0933544 [Tanacetum coccineum]